MALTNIQSIVSRLSQAEDAFVNSKDSGNDGKLEADFRKLRSELLLAGLAELAGHGVLDIQALPVDRFKPVPLIISTAPAVGGAAQRRTFGPLLAEKLNQCTKDYRRGEENQFIQKVKPSDHECIRSERMIRSLLVNVALDQSNSAPEVLDPITPAEMAAFAFPGGLLAGQCPTRAAPTPGP